MTSKDLKKNREIDDFLCGNLTPEQKTEFEKRLLEDDDMRQAVNATETVIEGIKAFAFKEMLKKIHREHFGTQPDGIQHEDLPKL